MLIGQVVQTDFKIEELHLQNLKFLGIIWKKLTQNQVSLTASATNVNFVTQHKFRTKFNWFKHFVEKDGNVRSFCFTEKNVNLKKTIMNNKWEISAQFLYTLITV